MENNIELACIIDDDAIYVNLLKKIIEVKRLCKNLLVFKNGEEALDYFGGLVNDCKENDIPEIIFVDLNMPIMDGWDFLDHFASIKKKFEKNIALYVVSSSINRIDVERAKGINAVADYLVKPIMIEELESIFSGSPV